MGRAPCCDKASVRRGPWSPQEDATLRDYLAKHGNGGNWISLPYKGGLKRCGKSCRLRWLNYLRPDIKHGGFTEEEDTIICTLYSSFRNTSIQSIALLISSVALLIETTAINTSSILKKLAIIALFTYVTFQLVKASPPLADRLPLFIVSFLIASITVPIIMWIGLAISAIYLVKVPYMEIGTWIRKHLEELSKQGQSIWESVIRTCIRERETQQAGPVDLERGDENDGTPQ